MDDLELQGPELKKTLKDLDKVNKWLGGNEITLEGIKKLIKDQRNEEPLKILDVGCGNGSVLKEVAQLGRQKGQKMNLLGIDANPYAVRIAEENSKNFPEIQFQVLDVFSEEFSKIKVDIILCTLTLHHFKDDEIVRLLQKFVEMSSIGIVINDLERSPVAYELFQLFCAAFINNKIAKDDGLVSIRRSFKKEDLERYGKELRVQKQEISWKWAFRYQWILYK